MIEVQLTKEFVDWLRKELYFPDGVTAEEWAQEFVSQLYHLGGIQCADELLKQRLAKLEEIIRQDTCCAYCGQAYPQGTPRFGDDALTEHIKVCSEHPMRELEKRIKELEEALRDARRQTWQN